METAKRNHHQLTKDAMEERRLRQANMVTITLHKNDLRMIVACLMIAQDKHAGILTWAQERAAANIAAGIKAEISRRR
jgi:hypothetical protein